MRRSMRLKLRQLDRTRLLSAEERARLLLDERTQRLATRPGGSSLPATDMARMLICLVGQEYYGIPLDRVAVVLPFRNLAPVPDGPAALIGMFGHGGHLVSAIELGAALGSAPPASNTEDRHLVLLRREQPQVALGVDRALGVMDTILLPPDKTRGFRFEAVTGYAKTVSGFADQERVLSLLDVDRLLQPFLSPSPVSGV